MFALSNPSLATQKVALGGRQVRARRAAPARRAVAVTPKARLYDNILETIGDTPIVKINRLAPEGVTMYAKAEFFNPCSSVKDRYVPERDRTRSRVSVSRAFTPDRTRTALAVGPFGTASVGSSDLAKRPRRTSDDSRFSPFCAFSFSASLRLNLTPPAEVQRTRRFFRSRERRSASASRRRFAACTRRETSSNLAAD